MSDSHYLHLLRSDCPLPPGTHVVLYTRDSGGDEQDKSIVQQNEAAQEYCQHFGLVLEHVYCDEAEKATEVEKRDQFTAMMTDLRQRFSVVYDPTKRDQRAKEKPFGILCWKSNRLGRDLLHTRHVKSDLRLRGLTIVSLVPIVETGNSGLDALIETFYEYQDQQLLQEISDNARRGLAQLVSLRDTDPEFQIHNPNWVSTGAYLGIMPGGIPVGFKSERITVGVYKRKHGKSGGEPRIVQRIVPDPELWERCRLAWQMRHGGASIRDIMDVTRLYKNVSGFASFFKNLIYTGTIEYGGQRITNFVPALIPMEWWEEEQKRKTERAKKMRGDKMDKNLEPRRVGGKHLLSGILYCGEIEGVEHPMLADFIPAKKGQRGHWDFYICSMKKNSRDHKCDAKRIGARVLEQSVIDALVNHVLTPDNLRPLGESIAQQVRETNNDASIRISAIQADLEQVERQIDNLLSAIENMGLSPSLKEKLTKREAEKSQLKSQESHLKKLIVKIIDIPQVTNEMIEEWIVHLRDGLKNAELEVSRRTLRQFVSKVVVKDGKGTIYYTFPVGSGDTKRLGLGKEDMDPRGFEPLTSTVRL